MRQTDLNVLFENVKRTVEQVHKRIDEELGGVSDVIELARIMQILANASKTLAQATKIIQETEDNNAKSTNTDWQREL